MPARSKFTEARQKVVIEAVRCGASLRTAAAEAGVGHQTLLRWMAQGKEADPESRFGKFYMGVQAAEAHPKLRALRIVQEAMLDNPILAWKFIERREDGYAPPMPNGYSAPTGPVIINLSLSDGAPVSAALPSTVIEVGVDEQDVDPGTASTS